MNPTLQLIVTRSQFPDTSDLPELSLFVITHLYSSLFHSPRPSSNTTNSRNVFWSNFFSMNTEYIWFVHQQRDKEDKKYVINTQVYTCVGLPWGLRWWRIRLQCRRPGLIPGSGRSPGEGNGYSLQYSCLESSMDRGAWHGLQRVGHYRATNTFTFFIYMYICKWNGILLSHKKAKLCHLQQHAWTWRILCLVNLDRER